MDQLTPEQRIAAYLYCIKCLDDGWRYPWLCLHLLDWCHLNDIHPADTLKYFPEFARHKPENLPIEGSAMWFSDDEVGRNKRKELLKECIEECLLLITQPTEQ